MELQALIAHVHQEATTCGLTNLSHPEHDFLKSIFDFSQRPDFNGLSQKQTAWLNNIAWKLEQARKPKWQLVAERNRSKFAAMRRSYVATCYGW